MTDERLEMGSYGATFRLTRELLRAELPAVPVGPRPEPARTDEDVMAWLASHGVTDVPPENEALRRVVLRARALRVAYLRDSALNFPRDGTGPFEVGHDVVAERSAPRPYALPPLAAKDIPSSHVLAAAALSAWLGLGSTRILIAASLGLEDGKLLQAKLDKLVRRGWLDGCTCGCRGDFVPIGLDDGIGTMSEIVYDGVPDRLLPAWVRS